MSDGLPDVGDSLNETCCGWTTVVCAIASILEAICARHVVDAMSVQK